jgi:hypothetical protein
MNQSGWPRLADVGAGQASGTRLCRVAVALAAGLTRRSQTY